MITNLEELVLDCVDNNARIGIEEAIKCYQCGAFRAAIVSAYVTVCFDLIEKLRALAAGGDGEAKNAESKLQKLQEQNDKGDPNAIKGLLEFERALLELFRDKFEFFGKNEFDELNRLREDRNRCAHPTFLKSALPFSPSAELTRLHIRNSLIHVLTQNPKQGRAALDSLEALVTSSYFPSDMNDAITRLQGSELANARPSLVKAFVDRFTFGFADKSSALYRKDHARLAVDAAVKMHRAIAIARLQQNTNKLLRRTETEAIFAGAVFALRQPEVGENVDDAGKTVVKAWVKSLPKTSGFGNTVSRGIRLSWLRDTMISRLEDAGTKDLESIAIEIEEVPRDVIQFAAKKYCTAGSWSQANRYASSFAIKFAPRFMEGDLRMIFSAAEAGEADLLGSNGFNEFLLALCSENKSKRALVAKLLKEFDMSHYLPEEIEAAPADP